MTFHLTEDQATIQQLARDFAQSELAPIAAKIDQEERIPKEIIEKMAEIGFTALNVPEAYGGPELDTVCKVLVVSELAKQCASTAEVIAVHTLVNDIFLEHGSEAQKQKYLTAAVEGKIGAFALTEPGAGSDAAAAKTKAVVDGDDYIINGNKCFISNMGPTEGDYVVVIALTEPEKGTKGMSAIVVDRGTPGFTIGKREEKLGIRGADISELIFEDCRVPRANLIGKEGDGFRIAMKALDGGRIGVGAQGLGIAEGAWEIARKYLMERQQFGKPLCKQQTIAFKMAELAIEIEQAKYMVYKAALEKGEGQPYSISAAKAKYCGTNAAMHVTTEAVQLLGGNGYMKEFHVERMMRDAKITQIYEGTNEIQKMIVSGTLFK